MNRWTQKTRHCVTLVVLMLITLSCTCLSETLTPTQESYFLSETLTPTPASLLLGEALQVGDLYVTVSEYDTTTDCVTSKSGYEICPSEGAIFLWIHLIARHTGDASALPVDASFRTTLLYRSQLLDRCEQSDFPDKPEWPGGCSGDWEDTQMYSGANLQGWLAFEVPSGFDIRNVIVHLDNWIPQFAQDWILAP